MCIQNIKRRAAPLRRRRTRHRPKLPERHPARAGRGILPGKPRLETAYVSKRRGSMAADQNTHPYHEVLEACYAALKQCRRTLATAVAKSAEAHDPRIVGALLD